MIEKVQNTSKSLQNPKNSKDIDSNKDSDVFAALLTGIISQNTNCPGNKPDGEIILNEENESALLNDIDNIKGLRYEFINLKNETQITDNLLSVDEKVILDNENLAAEQNIKTQYGLIQNTSIYSEKDKAIELPNIDLNLDSAAINTEQNNIEGNQYNSKFDKSVDDALYNAEFKVMVEKDDVKDFYVPRTELLKVLNNNQSVEKPKIGASNELKEGIVESEAVDEETKEKSINKLSLIEDTQNEDTQNKDQNYAEAEVEADEDLNIDKKEESKDKFNIIDAKPMNTNDDITSPSQSTKNYNKVTQNLYFDKNNVMDQLYDKIRSEAGRNYSELHVKLKPEELGDVAIKLIMEKGVLTAKIIVEDTMVKAMIESNLQDLKQQLKNQNISVSEFSVSLGLENNELLNKGFQNGRDNDSRNAREMAYSRHKRGTSIETNEDVLARDIKRIIDGNLNMLI